VQPTAPPEILALARARSEARAARDFDSADRLRGQIEAAGWRIVDRGVGFELEPANPPDLIDGARVRYGASTSVPSRLGDAPTAPATVVLVATDWPADLSRALDGLRAHLAADTQLVIAADAPSPDQAGALAALEDQAAVEIVWTNARLGHGAALNAAIRRALGAVVVILDTCVEPSGDIVRPLLAGLEDPRMAVVGGWGLVSSDLRHFREASGGDVAAIQGYALAFRRADYVARGPLDEHFRFYRNLDIWWSLVLRDEGEDVPPRRALVVPLPAERHEHRGWTSTPEAERERLSRRNFYRIIDRFGRRGDLAVGAP
jgi:GT2 family glycosyltransferase